MSETVKVTGKIIRETELAVCFEQKNRGGKARESWIPRSECTHISRRPIEGVVWHATIEMPAWLAEAKELEVEP
jgi:hypothetical protein